MPPDLRVIEYIGPDGNRRYDHNAAGAKWCPDHERYECVAVMPNGTDHKKAKRGSHLCPNHLGTNNRGIDKYAMARGRVNARQLAAELSQLYDTPIEDLPAMSTASGMKQALAVSGMRLRILNQLWSEQVEDEGIDGVVGLTYSSDGQGGRVVTGEQVRAIDLAYRAQQDAHMKLLKTAHDMGIAEREIELRQDTTAAVVNDVLESLRESGMTEDGINLVVANLERRWGG